ncbi:MAG: hypothetical protein AN484_25170 [Aphanizomenon flos-aquae WA102]|uniref:Uncharacterized protein n=1 Tax=Aphanizomenon flos-aquae WA102 TaxID=1710896 RepID=A0A1B7WJ85_APHFL|nr:MAG: hypothetical protein AN484_25170 [Aphanizomenon flos-aquae WA102]
MQHVIGEQRAFAGFEIDAELTDAQAVISVAAAADGTEFRAAPEEFVGGQGSERLDDFHLLQGRQLRELAHRLVAEVHLVHR